MEGEQPGGKMLVLGGTHANEPSGYLAAITFVESGKVEQGTVFVIPRTCNSGFTHNDPQEGSPQYYTIQTKGGPRQFRSTSGPIRTFMSMPHRGSGSPARRPATSTEPIRAARTVP